MKFFSVLCVLLCFISTTCESAAEKQQINDAEVEQLVRDFSLLRGYGPLLETIDLNNIKLTSKSKEILFRSVIASGDLNALKEIIKRRYLPLKSMPKIMMHSCAYGENEINVILFGILSSYQELLNKDELTNCAKAVIKNGHYAAFESLFSNVIKGNYSSSVVLLFRKILDDEIQNNKDLKNYIDQWSQS